MKIPQLETMQDVNQQSKQAPLTIFQQCSMQDLA